MRNPLLGKANPLNVKRRNRKLTPNNFIPARNGFDREIDNAANENRPIDQEKLRAELYVELPDIEPSPLSEKSVDGGAATAFRGHTIDKQEFQYRVMHRLLAQQHAMPTIATGLSLSVRQVYRIHEKLKKRYASDATRIDFTEYVGETIWDYRDLIASALRMSGDKNLRSSERLQALRAANDFKTSEIRFLQLTGFFERGIVRQPKNDENSTADNVDKTLELLAEVLNCAKHA